MSRSQDTIFALSSGALPSGVAVIRVSGNEVPALLETLLGAVPLARQATLKWIRGRNGIAIDQALIFYFPSPHSFTGEACAEFHLHGGRAVVAAMESLLAECGLRHAEAGEFSRRAFDNGKMDLAQIEGLADLISAETEMQRRLAIEQSSGGLSALYHSWMQQLTQARALIEAELDFPEEDDVPGAVSDQVWERVAALSADIQHHLDGHKSAEIIRDGFKIVISGPPNAGKSSLLNALAKRDVAIVTDVAGTTRDLISVDLDLGGYLVKITDTAGLRETEDIVEAEGVRRARLSAENADLILLLSEASEPFAGSDVNAKKTICVATKADLHSGAGNADICISAITGAGIDSLTKRILDYVKAAAPGHAGVQIVRQRQVDMLRQVVVLLAQCQIAEDDGIELRAELLRQASHALGKITGFVDTEDLLGVIFSEFCIGK